MGFLGSIRDLVRVRNVAVTLITTPLIGFAAYFLRWYLPIRVKEIEGIVAVGLLYSIGRAVSLILRPLAGSLMDIEGRKPFAILGSLIYASVAALLLSKYSVPIAVMLLFVAVAIMSNSAALLMLESIDRRERGVAMSLALMMRGVGSLVGTLVIPVILATYGMVPAATVASAAFVLAALGRLAYVETRVGPSSRSLISVSDVVKGMLRNLRKGFKVLFTGEVTYLTIFAVLTSFGSELVSRYLPIYLNSVMKYGIVLIGSFYAVMQAVLIASRPLAGYLSKLMSYSWLASIPTCISGIALIAMAYTKSPYAVLALFILLSLSEGVANVAIPPLTIGTIEKYSRNRATVISTQQSFSSLIALAAPIVGAAIWLKSPPNLMLTSGAILIAGGAALIPLIITSKKLENPKH